MTDRTSDSHLLFSIGPVQDFISAARTTRDLWAGSYLLSYLTWSAVEIAIARCGEDAVRFPHLGGQPLDRLRRGESPSPEEKVLPSLPNKAFIVAPPGLSPVTLAAEMETAVRSKWKEMADGVRKHLTRSGGTDGMAGWDAQIEGLLEIYWAVGVGSSEEAAYKEASALLDARKAVRSFRAWEGDEREKDTLDGLREQMGPRYEGPLDRNKAKEFWAELRNAVERRRNEETGRGFVARLRPNERLSAVNLVKRFAWDAYFQSEASGLNLDAKFTAEYPSTASVATKCWRKRAADKGAASGEVFGRWRASAMAFLKHIGELSRSERSRLDSRRSGEEWLLELDGSWLFPESYEPGPNDAWRDDAEANRLAKEARSALGRWLREAVSGGEGLESPPKYYAVLAMDGDEMGKRLSGEKGGVGGAGGSRLATISKALGDFSLKRARPIVEEEHDGKLVYAGGDDVLALLPVEQALPCAEALRREFQNAWRTTCGGDAATISAGIALAHHQDPLQRAIQEAQKVLKLEAKEAAGRDAFAFAALKRSGERLVAAAKWGGEEASTSEALREVEEAFRQGVLSPKLAHGFREAVDALLGPEGKEPGDSAVYKQMVKTELRRQFKRHREFGGGDEPQRDAARAALLDRLAATLEPRPLSRLLLTAAFLARGGEE